MPKDTISKTYRSSQDAAAALVTMTGSSRNAEAVSRRVGHDITFAAINEYKRRRKDRLNQSINATFCAFFAEEYAEEHGVTYTDALELAELWLSMKDAALEADTSIWQAVAERAETVVEGRDDLMSNMLRFSARWHLPRRTWSLPNDDMLYEAENQLRRSIAASDFSLVDSDLEGVLSIKTETYIDEAVDIEQRRKAEIELQWQRDTRFSPTGILLSTALIELLQLATLRGVPTLTELLRGLVAEGRLPLLFAAGRVFGDKYALMAATEALAEALAYIGGTPKYYKKSFEHADKLITSVAGMNIEEIPGYNQCAGPILKNAISELRKGKY